MGLDGALSKLLSALTEKVPPTFKENEAFNSCQNVAELRSSSAGPVPDKSGPTFFGLLRGQAKNSTSSLPTSNIYGPTSVECVHGQLGKSFVISQSPQLDSILSTFLSYR